MFKLALASIFIFSLLTRFWNLEQFNELVFDEAHYVKFGHFYLTGQDFYQVHPPIAQYLTALSMVIGKYLPFPWDTRYVNNAVGSLYSTFQYRWLNALFGSFLPLIVSLLAYQISFNKFFAILSGFLLSLDGLYLVESRYALNNIYIVVFGLLGQLIFFYAFNTNRLILLNLSGMFFGLSFATKWNGLGYILTLVIFCFIYRKKYLKIPFISYLNTFVLIPFLTYCISWIPHLYVISYPKFFEIHKLAWNFHSEMSDNNHPYCSKFYTWPFAYRPVAFVYKKFADYLQYVVALPNPVICWFSTLSLVVLPVIVIRKIFSIQFAPLVFISLGFVFNMLPWVKVSRCLFMYHYLPAYTYAIMALSLLLSTIWSFGDRFQEGVKYFLALALGAFIFWLPFWYGLPLTTAELMRRLILRSWI